jgi:hypothetical protein
MYILDLLDSMPRLRLSGATMKSILWALKALNVPDVPSFRQLRSVQKALAQKINISPSRHESAMGNIFYQNSLVSSRFPPGFQKFVFETPFLTSLDLTTLPIRLRRSLDKTLVV